ncbi:MAG TPA: hypothetical protein VF520_10455 [Thermoleophilaceae bacterium]
MTPREDVTFDSGGERCAAWLYRPPGDDPAPCVVLGHGLGGTRELGLDRYAERFADAGLAALAFDFRHLGASGGEPRQLIDPWRQLADYEAAVAYARTLDGVDPDRIGLWGSAYSSGHALNTASRDGRIAAVVAQLPYLGVSVRALDPLHLLAIGATGVLDELGRLLRRPPLTIGIIGPRRQSLAVLTTHDSESGYRSLIPPGVEWRNEVPARFALRAPLYWPRRAVSRISCPVLYCVVDHDSICPPGMALSAARATPRAELKRYPIGHFDICLGDDFERAIADQVEFLVRRLLGARTDTVAVAEPAV